MENTGAVHGGRQQARWRFPFERVPTFPLYAGLLGETLSEAAAQGGGLPCPAPGDSYMA